ncbi:MAG: hypothetical protein NO475_00640 [Candidatus Methanomethylicia archaeon]|jgi:DNA-directed RNA polymerase subunit RPC12/RpoP|uniref:Uncharacterized protein n=1 Tax=Thermoproteota archaeon TaxID=2056631 RepID=A0A523BGE3_9CREN|nr:hypothetical protein [Candidatus Methanomethylicia archaeon]TDA39922.1 MAG: hypothetical protein DSO09_01610 [Candidatus Verstraetearchaeota archaeon]
MTIRIICSKCNTTLYEDTELISPQEVMEKYDYKCPNCSSLLNFDPSNIRISIADKSKRNIFKLFL